MAKNHCPWILSSSSKIRNSMKMSHQLAKKNTFFQERFLVAPSSCYALKESRKIHSIDRLPLVYYSLVFLFFSMRFFYETSKLEVALPKVFRKNWAFSRVSLCKEDIICIELCKINFRYVFSKFNSLSLSFISMKLIFTNCLLHLFAVIFFLTIIINWNFQE